MLGCFNLGTPDDYRVPDGGLFRPSPDALYCPTAALVIEILSPGDETWDKLPFYAAHNVDEVLIVDPPERLVHWLALTDGQYSPAQRSGLIALGPAQLAEQINWP
jgi:Uma2 family endonuclease